MKHLARVLFALCLITSGTSHAQTLWGETVYGMSVDEVQALVRQAKAPPGPSRLRDGAVEMLRLENISIAGRTFDAKFYFLSGKLTQATLSQNPPPSSPADAESKFNEIRDALTSKYGAPISTDKLRNEFIDQHSANWISRQTNISVTAISIGRSPPLLNINYQMRISQDAGKL